MLQLPNIIISESNQQAIIAYHRESAFQFFAIIILLLTPTFDGLYPLDKFFHDFRSLLRWFNVSSRRPEDAARKGRVSGNFRLGYVA